MSLFDLKVPFFLPVWRRVVLVVYCLGWSAYELLNSAPFWGLVFGCLGVFAAQQLFFSDWARNSDSDDAPE